MLFYNTSCPSGWSNDNNQNNHALRTASTGGSKGGSNNFNTVFGANKRTDYHTLTTAQMPAHFHYMFRSGNAGANLNQGASNLTTTNYPSSGTGPSNKYEGYNIWGVSNQPNVGRNQEIGSSQGHRHNLTMDIKYINVKMCTKN